MKFLAKFEVQLSHLLRETEELRKTTEGSDIHQSVVTRIFRIDGGFLKQITATLDCNVL
jgi:hypothetical protein